MKIYRSNLPAVNLLANASRSISQIEVMTVITQLFEYRKSVTFLVVGSTGTTTIFKLEQQL